MRGNETLWKVMRLQGLAPWGERGGGGGGGGGREWVRTLREIRRERGRRKGGLNRMTVERSVALVDGWCGNPCLSERVGRRRTCMLRRSGKNMLGRRGERRGEE